MPFSAKTHRQQIIASSFAALTLLLISACVPPPATISPPPPVSLATISPPPENIPLPPWPEVVLPVSTRPETTVATPPPARASEEETLTAAAPLTYSESSASYYAKRFIGRRTFTGERYDPELMTAATRDFPLQSWIKVVNPANGREVNVRINDRTGKRKTPLIDLSRAAAKKLGFFGKGKIHVHVIPLLPSP